MTKQNYDDFLLQFQKLYGTSSPIMDRQFGSLIKNMNIEKVKFLIEMDSFFLSALANYIYTENYLNLELGLLNCNLRIIEAIEYFKKEKKKINFKVDDFDLEILSKSYKNFIEKNTFQKNECIKYIKNNLAYTDLIKNKEKRKQIKLEMLEDLLILKKDLSTELFILDYIKDEKYPKEDFSHLIKSKNSLFLNEKEISFEKFDLNIIKLQSYASKRQPTSITINVLSSIIDFYKKTELIKEDDLFIEIKKNDEFTKTIVVNKEINQKEKLKDFIEIIIKSDYINTMNRKTIEKCYEVFKIKNDLNTNKINEKRLKI